TEPERFRAEVRKLSLDLLGSQQPDPSALLRARLGQDELRPAVELEPERGCLRALLAATEILEPPGSHQVHEQHELAVIRREVEALRPPPRTLEAPALERGERRVEGLQRCDVRRAGLRDRERTHRLVEPAPPR